MNDRDRGLAVIAGGGVLLLGFWKGKQIAIRTLDLFQRGKRLNHTTINAQGYNDADPDALVAEAEERMGISIGRDVYAMARSGRSEGVDGEEYRMHVFVNQAGGVDNVFDLTVRSSYSSEDGHFGDQLGRRWASDRDPYEGDIRLALKVAADRAAGIDLSGGATNFVDKGSFGVQAGTGKYEALLEKWMAKGLQPYHLPGTSSDFVLFRPGSIPDGATSAV